VLLVGAGGIGCELLKDLILLGYGEVHVVDLDTIDLSNLNRQFLFRQKDIKKPKASTAVNAVESFNFFKTKLIPYQASIYETETFPLSWFKQFDIIFNALDNIAARSYINKIGLFLGKRIMESGTTGTAGQAQPTFPNKSECYDCSHRETPKTFPVCTIRSTPSQPVHCIHWAKSFLFNSLFAEDEITPINPEGGESELGTDNKDEIKNLINENNELLDLKNSIKDDSFVSKVIDKIFIKDIEKLLQITSLWKTRKPPSPLNLDELKIDNIKDEDLGTGQKLWTVEQNLKVFIDSTKTLQKRLKFEKEIEFDKDDEDTLNFVVSAANLRSFIFSIPLKSKFDIKSIAGNIIPAIATTNAIIAGFSSLLSLKLFLPTLDEQFLKSRSVFTTTNSTKFVSPSWITGPNPNCPSCSIPRGILSLDNNLTINDLIKALISKYGYEEEIAISLGSKLLYDVDFDDNKEKKLIELGIVYGEHLSINDETDVKKSVDFYVEINKNGEINLPDLKIPNKPKPIKDDNIEKEEEKNSFEEEESDFELIADDNDDDVIIMEGPNDGVVEVNGELKRKVTTTTNGIVEEPETKKQKV